jgi:hypothetical protein
LASVVPPPDEHTQANGPKEGWQVEGRHEANVPGSIKVQAPRDFTSNGPKASVDRKGISLYSGQSDRAIRRVTRYQIFIVEDNKSGLMSAERIDRMGQEYGIYRRQFQVRF